MKFFVDSDGVWLDKPHGKGYNMYVNTTWRCAVSQLTRSILNCSCGKPHICPIRVVEIGEGALLALPRICADGSHILLVADRNTYTACGKAADEILGQKIQTRHIFD